MSVEAAEEVVSHMHTTRVMTPVTKADAWTLVARIEALEAERDQLRVDVARLMALLATGKELVQEGVDTVNRLVAQIAASGLNPGETVAVPRDLRERDDGPWEVEFFPGQWIHVAHTDLASDHGRYVARPASTPTTPENDR